MPLDVLMRDGTVFDPKKPRTTYDDPPRPPPRDRGKPRRRDDGGGNNDDLALGLKTAVAYGTAFLASGYFGLPGAAITILAQTLATGTVHMALNEPEFSSMKWRQALASCGPQWVRNWNNTDGLRKIFLASAVSLCVSAPVDVALTKFASPQHQPTIEQAAAETVGRIGCDIALFSPQSGYRAMNCVETATLR